MKTYFYFHLDLVCTECIRGYGNWGYNDWNRWREEQGMLCRCLNFSYLLIVFSKDESRNMRRMPYVKFHLRRNDITITISFPFKPISTAILPRTTQDCWMDSNLECTNQDIDFKINENWSDSEILSNQAILNKLFGYYSRGQYHR